MIILDIKGIEVKLNNEKWECKDKDIERLLSYYTYRDIEGYTPFPDLTLAKIVAKILGGKIVKIINPPKFVKDRIY